MALQRENVMKNRKNGDAGSIMIVTLVLVVGLAGLSSVYLGRALYERRRSSVQEDSVEALFRAYGNIARAEAVLYRAGYDEVTSRNLELKAALERDDGMIRDTGVRVEPVGDPDDTIFFNLITEATVGRVTRIVRVLIRERESFADYNYFVNIHPLGIAGRPTPRGSIHTNKAMEFYFPNGKFVDPVTASEGFLYKAGATEENTTFLGTHDGGVSPITDLTDLDVPGLQDAAAYTVDNPDYNVKIVLEGDQVRIVKYTRPGLYTVPNVVEKRRKVGEEPVTHTREEPVYRTETWTETEPVYETETYTYTVTEPVYAEETYTYTESVPIYETQTYTYTETEPVYETRDVEKTRQVPVYSTRTVTKYRTETVWVEDTDASGGGTDIAGSPTGTPGHWEKQQVAYEETETYVSGYEDETYTVQETVKVGEKTVEKTGTRTVKVGEKTVEKTGTRTVKTGEQEVEKTGTRQVQVGEQEVTKSKQVVDHYETKSETVMEDVYAVVTEVDGTKEVWKDAEKVGEDVIGADGLIYVEGNVIGLEGELDGNVTVVSHGDVYVTGSLVYVDDAGRTAYLNGDNPAASYEPNNEYQGGSVLGVIAEGDILYTKDVPDNFELNGSFFSRAGRVGITGIGLDENGEAYLLGGN